MGGTPPQWHLGDIFRHVHSFAKSALRVIIVDPITGTFTFSGLSTEVKVTTLDVPDTEVALPATALSGRNSLSILNTDGVETLYIGPTGLTADNIAGTTSGDEIGPGNKFAIDITDSITLYARAEAGKTIRVKVSEYA